MRARPFVFVLSGVAVLVVAMTFWPSEPLRAPEELPAAPEAGTWSAPSTAERPVADVADVAPDGIVEAPPEAASPVAPSRSSAVRAPSASSTGASNGDAAPRLLLPECRMTAVLPTVPDITVDPCTNPVNVAEILEKEERDVGWAVDMEARLRAEILGMEGLAIERLEIECRTTSCGIVLVHAEGADSRRQQSLVTERVRDAVGFQQWGGSSVGPSPDGRVFSMISLMRAEGREQLWPAPPSVPAVPGVAGLDVPLLGISAIDNTHPAKILGEEADDPAWSRPAESRISNQVATLAPKSWYQSHVGCRSNTCGVVLLYPPGTDVDVQKVENDFAEALGFKAGGGRSYERDSGTLVTIYQRR